MQAAHQLAPRQRHQGTPNAYESEFKEMGIKFFGRMDSSGAEMFDRDDNPMTTYQHEGHGHLVPKHFTQQQQTLFFQHHQLQANGGTVNVHLHELALQQELSKRMHQMQQQRQSSSSTSTQSSSSSSSVTIAQFVQPNIPEMSTSAEVEQPMGNGVQSPPTDLIGVGAAKMGGAVQGQHVETIMAANTSMNSIKKNYGLEESDYEESPRKDNSQNGVEKKTISVVIDEDEPEEEMEQDEEDEPEVDNALNNGVGTSSSFTTKTISESALTAASVGTSSSQQQMGQFQEPFLVPTKVRGTAAELNALTAKLSVATNMDESSNAAPANEDTTMDNTMLDESTANNNTLNESTSSSAKRARKKKQPLTLTGTKKPRRRYLKEEYIASRIEDERGRGSNKEYLIKWEGNDDTTWEPAAHFQQFYLLIEDFEARKNAAIDQAAVEANLEQLDAERQQEEAQQQQEAKQQQEEAKQEEEAPNPPKPAQNRRAASKRRASRSTSAKHAKKEEGTSQNVGLQQEDQVHQGGQVQEEEKQPTTSSDRPRRNIRSSKKHMGIEHTPEPGVNFSFGKPLAESTPPVEQPEQAEEEPPSRPLTRSSMAAKQQEARARELLKESSPDPAVEQPTNAELEPQLPQQPAADDAVEPADRPVKRRSGSTKRGSAKKEKVGPAASTPFANEQNNNGQEENTNNIAYGRQQQLDGYDNPRKRSRSTNQRQSLSAKLHAEQTPIGRRNARRPQNKNNAGGSTPPMNNNYTGGQSTSAAANNADDDNEEIVAETPMTAVTTRSRAKKNAVVGNVQAQQQQPLQNAPPVQGRVPSAILDMRDHYTSVLVRFPGGEEEWQPMDEVEETASKMVIAHLVKKLDDVGKKLDDIGRCARNE